MSWDWEKLKERQQHSRGSGGSGVPPQVEEIVSQIKKFRLPGGPIIILVIILGFLALSSIYRVDQDEVVVVQRFGRFVRTTQPGLHLKLPKPIESIKKVRVRHVYKAEFGFQSARSSRSRVSTANEGANVALMLTGDLNVAIVPWIVQYRIKDPYNYLFKVKQVERLLVDMSEAAMRLVVGDRSINEIISKRVEIANDAQQVLQAELENAEAGISIITIEMKKTNVPGPVQRSFNEVNQAIQEKEKMIYQARENYNTAIPAARGTANKTIKEAEGYALDRVNRAKGDASRFNSLYAEYSKARDVTKRRLYLETLKDLYPKFEHKYIIDAQQNNLLPLLNLGGKNGVLK